MSININELRRLAQAASPGPDGVSLSWITFLQDFQQSANPAAISELLDRLEAAEKERDWNAERLEDAIEELTALRAKVETAENDAAHQKALAASALRVAEGWERKCRELRAKIEVMEKQEPVAAQHRFRHPHKNMPTWTDWWLCEVSNRPAWEVDSQGYEVEYRALYTLPGAKGE